MHSLEGPIILSAFHFRSDLFICHFNYYAHVDCQKTLSTELRQLSFWFICSSSLNEKNSELLEIRRCDDGVIILIIFFLTENCDLTGGVCWSHSSCININQITESTLQNSVTKTSSPHMKYLLISADH